jgi:NHL repeat-containing protein
LGRDAAVRHYVSVSARNSRVAGFAVALVIAVIPAIAVTAAVAASAVPTFEVDTHWPRLPLPNNWTLGELAGIAVDAKDHIWVLHRPRTLQLYERAAAEKPPIAECCVPAPPVIEFDASGRVLRAWGGPGHGYDWPAIEHGLTVDYRGNVWIGGNSGAGAKANDPTPRDGMVLKFTPDGRMLLQIGHAGPSKGSSDPTQLGGASNVAVDPKTNEVFVADGYVNNRIIVFDADSGKFKRMWGAYGRAPTDLDLPAYNPAAPPDTQFRVAHCIKLAADGLLYVCDFYNNRMQVFRTDGHFVAEYFYARNTLTQDNAGSVADVAFWPDADQSLLVVADTANNRVRIARRSSGQELSAFGHFGYYAGQLSRIHQIAVDSKGNIYTAEAAGRRIQKFSPIHK